MYIYICIYIYESICLVFVFRLYVCMYVDMYDGMRSAYQDPTFNTMMRMSTPSEGIYGDLSGGAHDAYSDTLRRGGSGRGHIDQVAMMQQQHLSSNGMAEYYNNDYNNDNNGFNGQEGEDGIEEEIYHIDLSN